MENPKLVQGLEETRLNCRRSRSSGKRKHPSKTSPTRQEFTSKQTVGNGLLWPPDSDVNNFSTLNESDLALASLEALDNGASILHTANPTKSNEASHGSDCLSDTGAEQDLFDDDQSDHGTEVIGNNASDDGASFNDSFSEIFFRSAEKDMTKYPSANAKISETPCSDGDRGEALSKDRLNTAKDVQTAAVTFMSTPKKSSYENWAGPPSGSAGLKERLKQRLQTNVGVTGVQKRLEEDIRREAIVQAQLEASQIRREGTGVDIGPFYGLPGEVQRLLQSTRGISKLYDWQRECLQLEALKHRRNLIYSLPTSGGKTLVAEILIMRELLCHKRDALFVLPFVSIVQEKVRAIAEFAIQFGFIVEEYAGSKGRFPPIKRREKKSLYIATIEKAHSLVNSLIESNHIGALGLIVVDELHMLGEGGSRGSNLEALLLKTVVSKSGTQIIGMSATLNNIADLQQFLHAEVYSNDFRPVPLKEFVKVNDNVFRVNHGALQEEERLAHEKFVTFPYSAELLKEDPDHLLGLVLETIPQHSCLVFCSSKKNCENVAVMLSKLMARQCRHMTGIKREKRKDLLRELSQDGEGNICPVLQRTVHFGIGYHHSGLTMDERRLIEDAYSEGTLCLLTCTSTLAAGVNLPAKRVILRSPYVGMSLIKHSQYKQMVGRAGRAGIDSSGESYLIVNSQDRMKVKEMLSGPQDVCHSSLGFEDGKGVKSLLLSAIGLKMVTSTQAAFGLIGQSLLHIQSAALGVDVKAVTKEAITYLLDRGLVFEVNDNSDNDDRGSPSNLQVSPIGRATFKGSVDHGHSVQLYKDLKCSESSLNLSTYLHLLYLVTPYEAAHDVTPTWDIYFKKFCSLSELESKVASAIGVPEHYLGLKSAGRSSRKKVCPLTVKRFYLTLMLWDLWKQHTVWEVADVFSQTRGFIQNLLSQAAAFASCVLHYCQELEEFWAYQALLENFVKRLAHCVSSELLPLMEIPGVKLARAKQLYAAGYKSVALLAAADVDRLVNSVEYMSRRAALQIMSAAKNILEEKTAALMEEVDLLTAVDRQSPAHRSDAATGT